MHLIWEFDAESRVDNYNYEKDYCENVVVSFYDFFSSLVEARSVRPKTWETRCCLTCKNKVLPSAICWVFAGAALFQSTFLLLSVC
jgi:hypothetical protein